MHVTRRQFLKGSIVAAATINLRPWLSAIAAGGRVIPISLQLYSVRKDCANNFDTTLAWAAKAGFAGVEFAGYYNYKDKAKELRAKLDDLGIKAAGTHIGTSNFRGDALAKTIEFHQAIGCKFLMVPGDKDFTNPEKSKALAEFFNKTAETLKPLGMYCGYHNHTVEFKKCGDKTFYDLFAERTSKDVVLQQDCGWTAAAGIDPAEMMKRYPGRMKTTHFKPAVVGGAKTKKAIIGQDSVNWPAVIAACRDVGGTEWITLEQETYPDGKTPMVATELSLAALKKLLLN